VTHDRHTWNTKNGAVACSANSELKVGIGMSKLCTPSDAFSFDALTDHKKTEERHIHIEAVFLRVGVHLRVGAEPRHVLIVAHVIVDREFERVKAGAAVVHVFGLAHMEVRLFEVGHARQRSGQLLFGGRLGFQLLCACE
jgi:hypothetical protein